MAAFVHPTVAFYDPASQIPYDRSDPHTTLEHVLRYSDSKLEYRHDFIQHLFPLPEPSGFNSEGPTLTREVVNQFRTRQELRDNLRQSFLRMMDFWGFAVTIIPSQYNDHDISMTQAMGVRVPPVDLRNQLDIIPGPDFYQQASQTWLQTYNHNQLRINRMIRSLRILGLQREAEYATAMFLASDLAHDNIVNDTTLQIWLNTATRPLVHPPPRPAYHRLVDQHECEWLREEDAESADHTIWTYQYPVLVRRTEKDERSQPLAGVLNRDGRRLERVLPETTTYGQLYAEIRVPSDRSEEGKEEKKK